MKISELEKIILENSSKINLERAEKIIKCGDLIKISINKIDSDYNIYGSFKAEKKIQTYNSHLKINFKGKKISLSKCECSMFLDAHSKHNVYLCEHLVATGLAFIQQVKSKIKQKTENKDVLRKDKNILLNLYKVDKYELSKEINSSRVSIKNIKEKLELNVSIKEVKEEKNNYFDLSLFIGINSLYPITNIKEFIISYNKFKSYHIGKGLIYNPERYFFSKEDRGILEYIYDYILISKDSNLGNNIRIHKEILRRFFKKLVFKKIKFNYNYQTYTSEVKHGDLPISFTLKQVEDNYVLTTKKIFPMPLNEKMDVFFFDRKIYIPSLEQIKLYKILYYNLIKDQKIIFHKDIHIREIADLISYLNIISKSLTLDEAIIDKLEDNIKVKFDFQKKEDNFCCNVTLMNNEKKISYEEALNTNDEIIKKFKKIRLIESELNKNRFFYKNGTFIFYGTDDDYYYFLKEKFQRLEELGDIIISKENNKYFKLCGGNIHEVCLDENEYNNIKFSFKLDGIDNKDLSDVIYAYNNKKRYIKLKDNTFVDLEDKELVEFIRIMDALNVNVAEGKDKYELELNKLFYLNNKLNNTQIHWINKKESLNEMLKRLDKLNENHFEVPSELKGSLREYQVKGYNWLKSLSYLDFGGILSDEMGLGKTIQIITFLLSEKNKNSLIVTPASLIYNWKQEFDKFAPSLKVGIIHGNKNERMKIFNTIKDYEILLTTYGTLKNDILKYESNKFDYLIIDEGQNINNDESQNAKVIKLIKSKNRFVLTGTPIENNLMELWALFDFIMPGYLYTKREFSSKFVNQKDSIEDLKILISPYILRRTKKDVIKEIPEKIESRFLVEMTESQKKIYKAFIKDIKKNIMNININKNNITIFSYLTKLRQIRLDPSLIFNDYTGGSGKINTAKELILQNIKEHKILLFSQFTSVLKIISNELELQNIKYLYLDGSTSPKNRINLVDEFNNNEEARVFLISLKAGGTGLNLTSADIVIHFDPWWNLSVEDQATDRAHRIGQKHVVEVIKLIAKDTIEEKILLLQNDKKELIDNVLAGELKDENIINKLKSDDILNLFFG